MHSVEPFSQLPSNAHVTLNSFTKDKLFKNQSSSAPIKKFELKLNDSIQAVEVLLEDSYSQAKFYLSRIQDPLWKSVCTEMLDIIGSSSVDKLWNSKLGTYYDIDKTMEFCCPTVEVAQFIDRYSFLILGSLQCYFPNLKYLRIKV